MLKCSEYKHTVSHIHPHRHRHTDTIRVQDNVLPVPGKVEKMHSQFYKPIRLFKKITNLQIAAVYLPQQLIQWSNTPAAGRLWLEVYVHFVPRYQRA